MLSMFQVKRTFYKLTVSVLVDVDRKQADMTITYDRRIVCMGAVPFWKMSTPDAAESFLGAPAGERGNMMESWEWQCRTGVGIGAPDKAAA